MDQPHHPTPGNFPSSDAQQSGRQEAIAPASAPDFGALETMAVSAVPAKNSHLNSSAMAVLGRRYDILAEAGRGAMGQVYKARDRETGEIIALKLLKPEIASDPEMVERFKSELLFARRITHKNVCRVYEFNRVDGIAYTSMEFVEGESLRSVLKRFGSLTQRKGIAVALQMCAGLKEAHAQGIVHRDLKPENVMIDAQGNVKVMDFGIARSMEALTLVTGSLVGTPAYMAPEQAAGKSVDYRADIYALGLMLYEMFAGEQPFRADNAVALALKHMQEPPRPPREIEPSLPEPMERAILKCLEKNPERRFQQVAELEAALRSQLPASVADGTVNRFPSNASSAAGAASIAAAAISGAKPAQKASWAAALAAALAAGVITLGAGWFWHNHAKPGPATASVENSNSPSAVLPNVKIEASPTSKPVSGTPKEAAEGRISSPAKTKKLAAEAHRVSASAAPAMSSQINAPRPAGAPAIAGQAPSAQADVTATPAPQAAPPGLGNAAAKGGGGYVWVSRFPREVRAQNAAGRIETMGLPVTIIPRHNPVTDEDFFVVLTGPYSAAKIDGIVERLKAKGFSQARPNKTVAGAAASVTRRNLAPSP
jgi:serine/threonine protein kinase